jgi:hypothetical protein
MTENMGKWPSGHSKTETIRSSDGCGETSVPSTMVRGYDFYRPGGYLGNPGLEGSCPPSYVSTTQVCGGYRYRDYESGENAG